MSVGGVSVCACVCVCEREREREREEKSSVLVWETPEKMCE